MTHECTVTRPPGDAPELQDLDYLLDHVMSEVTPLNWEGVLAR